MSAYVVSENHINLLVSWMACGTRSGTRKAVYHDGKSVNVWGNEQMLADALMNTNIKAVNTRYRENEPLTGCKFSLKMTQDLPLIQIIKLAHCYEYQASELGNYEDTLAAAFIRNLISEAVRMLPGYDAASWSVD